MGLRLLADENVDDHVVRALEREDHDIEQVENVEALGASSSDEAIAEYARWTDRLVLTHDDDFVVAHEDDHRVGVLFDPDGRRSPGEAVRIIAAIERTFGDAELSGVVYLGDRWL